MTLHSEALGEHYHSLFGAVAESEHVYIGQGFRTCGQQQVDMLEVGLGTGLNALLTLVEAQREGTRVNYLALEPFPLAPDQVRALNHPDAIGRPDLAEAFVHMMSAKPEETVHPVAGVSFRRSALRVQELEAKAAFDLVYFDAFAPKIQPEMWSTDVFRRLHDAMRPGACLVTYCAKGDVRRAMRDAGLVPQLVKGPPGKYKMLKAQRR